MVLLLLLLTAKGHLEIIDTEYSVRTAISILEEQTLQIELVDSNVLGIMPNIEGSSQNIFSVWFRIGRHIFTRSYASENSFVNCRH